MSKRNNAQYKFYYSMESTETFKQIEQQQKTMSRPVQINRVTVQKPSIDISKSAQIKKKK